MMSCNVSCYYAYYKTNHIYSQFPQPWTMRSLSGHNSALPSCTPDGVRSLFPQITTRYADFCVSFLEYFTMLYWLTTGLHVLDKKIYREEAVGLNCSD